MKTNPNDAAFVGEIPGEPEGLLNGLTKREYFAAMAMQGIASGGCQFIRIDNKRINGENDVAMVAVFYADALIKALNEEQK